MRYFVWGRNGEASETFLDITTSSIVKARKMADKLFENPIISSAWVEDTRIEDPEDAIVYTTARKNVERVW